MIRIAELVFPGVPDDPLVCVWDTVIDAIRSVDGEQFFEDRQELAESLARDRTLPPDVRGRALSLVLAELAAQAEG